MTHPMSQSDKAASLRGLLDDCLRRRLAGEKLSDDAILAAHPDLLPELAEELRKLSLIQQADHAARQGETLAPGAGTPESGVDPQDVETLIGHSSSSQPPADSFAGYQLLREIHRGGQGVVYQALQKSTNRKVAIKVMKEGPFAGPADRARFEREVQILGQLQHPNIVSIHDSGSAAGSFYFVMDYIPGQPLDVYMASGKRSIDETLKLFGKICDAVNAAHLRGVIHRDLKPGNIRVDPSGQPHILDFGLAKVSAFDSMGERDAPVMTVTGQFIGSLPWASPEQAEGQPSKIDVRTDVYSLGVILYEMLTGKFPYEVFGAMRDVLDRILKAEPAKPSTIRKQINDEVETIVLKCLSKERERRYQTAGELARDIGHYLAGEPVEAKRDSGLYVLRKTLRRYRAAVSVATAFVVIVTMSAFSLAVMYQNQSRARKEAEGERRRTESALLREAEARQKADEQREFADERRNEAERIADFMEQTLSGVGPSVALGRDTTMLREMMDAAAKRIADGELDKAPEAELRLRLTISRAYMEIAEFPAAHAILDPAFELARNTYGAQHVRVADALSARQHVLSAEGKAEDALEVARAVLELDQQLFDGDHATVAVGLNNVAGCLFDLGRSAEALPIYEDALGMIRRLNVGDHPNAVKGLDGLARCLQSLGRLAEALPKFEAALEMCERLFRDDHPDKATSQNGVGTCLVSLGRASAALPKLVNALEMRQRLFKGDHPLVAASLIGVGDCLTSLGRPVDALPKFEAALEIHQRLFKGDHPAVASSLNAVAFGLDAVRRSAEALPKFEAALEMRQRMFKGDHPDVVTSMNNVAFCLQNLGHSAEAVPRYEAALSMLQRLYNGDHPHLAGSRINLGLCLQSLGRSAEARHQFQLALEMQRRILPPGHPDMLWAQIGLASTMIEEGEHREAETLLLDAVSQCDISPGSRRTHWGRLLKRLVQLYEHWDSVEPQAGYDVKAAEWRAQLAAWQASTQPTNERTTSLQTGPPASTQPNSAKAND